jgi:hypothetical protein
MQLIKDKIQVGSMVVANGRFCTITEKINDLTYVWEHSDGGTGTFQFTDDQTEDSQFVIIT